MSPSIRSNHSPDLYLEGRRCRPIPEPLPSFGLVWSSLNAFYRFGLGLDTEIVRGVDYGEKDNMQYARVYRFRQRAVRLGGGAGNDGVVKRKTPDLIVDGQSMLPDQKCVQVLLLQLSTLRDVTKFLLT